MNSNDIEKPLLYILVTYLSYRPTNAGANTWLGTLITWYSDKAGICGKKYCLYDGCSPWVIGSARQSDAKNRLP